MEFNYYSTQINEMQKINVKSLLNNLKNLADNKLKKTLKDGFDSFKKLLIKYNLENKFLNIYNKQFKTNYTSINQFNIIKEDILNEDWKHFLGFWKSETYPALAIFPTLQIWFQLDKLFDGANLSDLNWKKMAFYAVFWIIIVTGQHAILFKQWKKQNPAEYNKEGKPGIFKTGAVYKKNKRNKKKKRNIKKGK